MDAKGYPGASIDCAGPATQGRGPRGAPTSSAIGNLEILAMEEDRDSAEHFETDWDGWLATDDVKGGELSPQLVHDARTKELKY